MRSLLTEAGPWGEGECTSRPRVFQNFSCCIISFFEKSSILQMCNPRDRNRVPDAYRRFWVWRVDPRSPVVSVSLMQRTFSVDSTSVLFLPEGSGLLDPVLLDIPGENQEGARETWVGVHLCSCVYWLGDAFRAWVCSGGKRVLGPPQTIT